MMIRLVWPLVVIVPCVMQGQHGPLPRRSPGGALSELGLASFGGSGQSSIQSIATDTSGNIYVAGATTSPDLPVKNAYQAKFAEARVLRTNDLGVTWNRVTGPPDST